MFLVLTLPLLFLTGTTERLVYLVFIVSLLLEIWKHDWLSVPPSSETEEINIRTTSQATQRHVRATRSWLPGSHSQDLHPNLQHPTPLVSERHTGMEGKEMSSSVTRLHMSDCPRYRFKKLWTTTCVYKNDSFEENKQRSNSGSWHSGFSCPFSSCFSESRVVTSGFNNTAITKADGQSIRLQWKPTWASPHHVKL